MLVIVGTKTDLRAVVSINEIEEKCKKWSEELGLDVDLYMLSAVQENSAHMLRKMLYKTVNNYHGKILTLAYQNKEIPEYTTLKYFTKNNEYVELETDDVTKLKYCCFQ